MLLFPIRHSPLANELPPPFVLLQINLVTNFHLKMMDV